MGILLTWYPASVSGGSGCAIFWFGGGGIRSPGLSSFGQGSIFACCRGSCCCCGISICCGGCIQERLWRRCGLCCFAFFSTMRIGLQSDKRLSFLKHCTQKVPREGGKQKLGRIAIGFAKQSSYSGVFSRPKKKKRI